jgi:hypothetical protein
MAESIKEAYCACTSTQNPETFIMKRRISFISRCFSDNLNHTSEIKKEVRARILIRKSKFNLGGRSVVRINGP